MGKVKYKNPEKYIEQLKNKVFSLKRQVSSLYEQKTRLFGKYITFYRNSYQTLKAVNSAILCQYNPGDTIIIFGTVVSVELEENGTSAVRYRIGDVRVRKEE